MISEVFAQREIQLYLVNFLAFSGKQQFLPWFTDMGHYGLKGFVKVEKRYTHQ